MQNTSQNYPSHFQGVNSLSIEGCYWGHKFLPTLPCMWAKQPEKAVMKPQLQQKAISMFRNCECEGDGAGISYVCQSQFSLVLRQYSSGECFQILVIFTALSNIYFWYGVCVPVSFLLLMIEQVRFLWVSYLQYMFIARGEGADKGQGQLHKTKASPLLPQKQIVSCSYGASV